MPVETVLPLCSLFHFFPMTRLDNLFFFSNRERAFAPKAPLFTLCYFFEKFFNKMSVPRIRTSRLNSFILLIPKSHSFIFILLLLASTVFCFFPVILILNVERAFERARVPFIIFLRVKADET